MNNHTGFPPVSQSVHGLESLEFIDAPVEALQRIQNLISRNRMDDPIYQAREVWCLPAGL